MTLANLLSPDRVIADLKAADHWQAIVELVDHLILENYLPEEEKESVLAAIREREERSSTGMGGGIAIPHCYAEGIDDVVVIFGRSTEGVDFCAVDCAPVYFITLIIVPKDQYSTHLKTLAAIAKQMNSADTRNRLSDAENAEEIFSILTNEQG